jgi:flavin reductase (DIM6/NTAB) family NADH-FMN oxidoreductase RutF
MAVAQHLYRALKKIAYGDTSIPQEFTIALRQPQSEVAVYLEGLGPPLDVTNRHTIACCAPLVIAISLEEDARGALNKGAEISLIFRERAEPNRILGLIRLSRKESIPLNRSDIDRSELVLFAVLGSRNFCLPRPRLWAHYLSQSFLNWRKFKSLDVKMSSREIRASQVAFIRPHPLMLGSLSGESGSNIFPMNLLGDLGDGYIAFALKDSRRPAHLVERCGCLALSSVPMPLCSIAFQLAINHTRESIDWSSLPFAVNLSKEFKIPVPASAPRVRELRVERVEKIGSHTFFVARVLSDEARFDEPQVHIIHGFYQHWRLKGDKVRLKSSLIDDSLNKHGLPAS